LWKKYKVLEVYLPDKEYVLAQKLLINRPKDHEDIRLLFQALGIATKAQAQALLDRYLSQNEQRQLNLTVTLQHYFP
jgi:hypothetical protein